MRISNLASEVGLTAKTIRYYEEIGLLEEPERLANGYRDYAPDAVGKLRFVRDAQAAGLTLAEVGEILGMKSEGRSTCSHTSALLNKHLSDMDEQIARLQSARAELAALVARSDALDPSGCTDPDRCQVIALDLPVDGKVYGGSRVPVTAPDGRKDSHMSSTIDITVTGMTCEGCAGKVRSALVATDGISAADIDVASGRVTVHADGTVDAGELEFAIDEAVNQAGYSLA